MKATVVEIQSRKYYTSGKPHPYRVVALQFDLPLVEGGPILLRLPEFNLGIAGLCLDDEVEVTFNVDRVEPFDIEEHAGDR
jgi:hypothetical protein